MTNLQNLTDAELLRLAYAQLDPMTSTAMECELLRRLEETANTAAELQSTLDALDNAGVGPEDVPELMKLLEEFNASDLKTLREKLERADKWFSIAEEAGDLFQRLQDLTNTTL